ncbi:MAG TPA: DoxX family protein, partial [Gemmatimonadales bacterium]|nr:DoxX family protein [Gemmatimonadales bacterium]
MHNREDLGKLILRLALGGVVLFHGVFKLTHGVDWIKQPLAAHGLPGFLAYGAYLAEVLAPVLIVVGWKARLAALAIGFDMLMALYLVLRPQILAVKPQGGGWG